MIPLNEIFNVVLYQPLFNVLVLLNEYLPGHDFGISVIVLTILIKFLFYPLGIKTIRSQKILTDLQPKIKEIQEKHKEDKEKQTKAIMELYQKEKINPFSGCLPVLIQLPILIALYQVFWKGFQPEQMINLYHFVPKPEAINPIFLGLVNLSQPNVLFSLLAGISQFFQSKMLNPKQDKSKQPSQKKDQVFRLSGMMQKQMQYLFPIFTVLIVWKLPSAIALYWIITTLFSIVQQHFILKKSPV